MTSFTDDFNRAELGPNYAAARGAAFVVRESQVLTNCGAGQDRTYLTLGTLPTAEDYANGYMFTASIDLFIPASGQASVVTAGLVLNEQDLKGGTANRVIRFRGHGANRYAIQLGGGLGGESVNMGTLSNSTWHTLTVSSTEPGKYRYAFSERGSPQQSLSGRFVQTAPHILTGGHIGFYTENAAAGAYQFDNFSVKVKKRAAVARNELLLFSDQQDIADTWGKIHFGTSPLQHLRSCANPRFELCRYSIASRQARPPIGHGVVGGARRLRWDRPGRDVNALGGAFPGNARITHNPMIIGGQFLFHFGNHLVGIEQDRISYVGARANAEFSTTLFAMPQGDLLLNAAVPSLERAFAAQQAYVRVAVLDEKGAVVPGFEAEKCLIQNDDDIGLPLLWTGRSAQELAGQKISLRFQLRSASIYAVMFKK